MARARSRSSPMPPRRRMRPRSHRRRFATTGRVGVRRPGQRLERPGPASPHACHGRPTGRCRLRGQLLARCSGVAGERGRVHEGGACDSVGPHCDQPRRATRCCGSPTEARARGWVASTAASATARPPACAVCQSARCRDALGGRLAPESAGACRRFRPGRVRRRDFRAPPPPAASASAVLAAGCGPSNPLARRRAPGRVLAGQPLGAAGRRRCSPAIVTLQRRSPLSAVSVP